MYIFCGNINKEDRIVIYGAGKVGCDIFFQLYNYNIVTVVDNNADNFKDIHSVKILHPAKLINISFDKIIIAIKNEFIYNCVKQDLINKYSVIEKKIVPLILKENRYVRYYNFINFNLPKYNRKSKVISIAICNGGGLGDLVVRKKWLVAMYENGFWDKNILVDLFCTERTFEFSKILYSDCIYIRNVYNDGVRLYDWKICEYDIAIYLTHNVTIDKCDIDGLKEKNFKNINKWIEYVAAINRYGLNGYKNSEERVHIDRCKLLGKNQYTGYSHDGILDIYDTKVNIPLLKESYNEFSMLNLEYSYITVNYGWSGSDKFKDGRGHTKVWLLEYYNLLIIKLKNEYPNIKIIQLGIKNANKIMGVDRYVLGLSLETVKYVLKNSLLHIDCEGGLVHIASQLGTKCIVLFGPTPEYFFGYKENINIVSEKCRDCIFCYDDLTFCPKMYDIPVCMNSITPDIVMEKIKNYLSKCKVVIENG